MLTNPKYLTLNKDKEISSISTSWCTILLDVTCLKPQVAPLVLLPVSFPNGVIGLH